MENRSLLTTETAGFVIATITNANDRVESLAHFLDAIG